MSKWPEYKKKPYYDALTSFMATTHDMDTGKLLDSAVQPAVTAALAAESTVVQAAEDAAAAAVTPEVVTASIDALAVKELGRVPLLQHINRARTGVFTVTHVGTSVGATPYSAGRVLGAALQTIYGRPTAHVQRLGVLGGSYTASVDGWEKQHYGGLSYTRLRGKPASSTLDHAALKGRGNRITIEWSQEADSGVSDVLVDGVVVGQVGAAGAQAYGQQTTFAVAQGQHIVTIAPPASGYTYLESLTIWTDADTGVEVIDGALGGSSLRDAVTLKAALSGQVAGIAISGNAGLDALFDRDDTDLMSVSFTLNDAGAGLVWAEGGYQTAMDYAVQKTAERGIPMLITIEMGGHYHDPLDPNHAAFNAIRDYLLGLRAHPHVTVLDWHGATASDDIAAYMAAYYGATGYNPVDGTYTGDFTHPTEAGHIVSQTMAYRAAGMEPPTRTSDVTLVDATRNVLVTPTTGFGVVATVDAATVAPPPIGVAFAPLTEGAVTKTQGRRVPLYRIPTAYNAHYAVNANTDIATSPTGTNEYGPYKDWALNTSIGLGTLADWAGGERMQLSVKTGGTFEIRAGSPVQMYTYDGELMVGSGAQAYYRYVVDGDAPIVVTIQIGASANFGTLVISGRIYEVAFTKSDVPLLVLPPA